MVGRRRIGKTFLIEEYYGDRIVFSVTGTQNSERDRQLQNFAKEITQRVGNLIPVLPPKDWNEAFDLLKAYLKTVLGDEKCVVFIDEMPWLATHKSGFIEAFGYFWNTWARKQNLVLVICGSAASWMIQKVVNDTGRLHNRITKRIYLKPFTLAETEDYFQNKHIHFNRHQILELYMALGGVPHYLKNVVAGMSATQNINELCFSENAPLKDEFKRLYHSLFKNADNHIAVIRALASKRKGMTRLEIATATRISSGGTLSRVLGELDFSGFIDSGNVFGKKKRDKIYRLTDEYSLFYLKFMENNDYESEIAWNLLAQTQPYKSWSGYAFEGICLKHIRQLKNALHILGVLATSSSFQQIGNDDMEGAQIDLLIDRNDRVINLCEIKFYQKPLSLTKAQAKELRRKQDIFRETTKTKKHLSWVLITTFGLEPNQHSLGLINNVVALDDLFEELK